MQIFLSRPTWISSEFEEGLKIFLMCLKNMGLEPRTLGASDYPSKAPLDEVIEILNQCDGAIILGYPQICISKGSVKAVETASEIQLPTEWNHIEASLAYAKGLPLLLAHHTTVSRGVFDRGVMNAFVHSINMTKPSWCMEPAFNGALTKWKQNCESGNSNYPSHAIKKAGVPICPNCSTPSKPIYMSALPAEMNDFGNWHCSKCNYMEM